MQFTYQHLKRPCTQILVTAAMAGLTAVQQREMDRSNDPDRTNELDHMEDRPSSDGNPSGE